MFKKSIKKKLLSFALVSTIAVGGVAGSLSAPEAEAKSIPNKGKAKNVIFMIPDGYSTSYATNYRWYKGEETVLDSMLVGMQRTYSANSKVTDSAAAGTAMATGVKTNNGMISTSPDGKDLETVLEAAEKNGKSSGLVATSTITHATPAVFASHVASRADEAEIAPQLLDNDVDVILGGGKNYFPETLLNDAKKDGYKYVSNKNELKNTKKTNKLIGLFADEGMAPELDRDETNQPSLADMTKSALDVLKRDKNGFFLMVEGSQIDWAGHDNDAAWAMKDSEAFEDAVAEAVKFAKKDGNTLVVVTGDHDTGGMSVGGYGKGDANPEILRNVTATGDYMANELNKKRSNVKKVVKKYTSLDLTNDEANRIKLAENPSMEINKVISERALVGWTSTGHTGTDVPLYAYGPGSDLFAGLHENTDLPVMIAKAMKVKFKPGK
ncbi:alkaline phosphatase [Cytobacillus horneckiae]|uniref:Alkaline phosphatase n=1 Tax=Cytobacillus horneckiae TaxID=549687 RepID=A0A2N0ZG49_9BACI|nr:alkaline phosphatase [Cytobacillus horneckiae]MEC1155728.1 alkaline phosphatase [Cytobacillus horneckiae]MED2939267.1 alkaline phosphatase [Cytobacillus horneckiae]PKG28491.1 alkaline phosphatase [Cytobacillus horneckiae]